jgi:hypothetical protein
MDFFAEDSSQQYFSPPKFFAPEVLIEHGPSI